jgi:Skp family chaperone for outer membrane proteins
MSRGPSLVIAVLFASAAAWLHAQFGDIHGTITEVGPAQTVWIEFDATEIPPADSTFDVVAPDGAKRASGRLQKEKRGRAVAGKLEKEITSVQVGDGVWVVASHPATPSPASSPDESDETSAQMGFAFVDLDQLFKEHPKRATAEQEINEKREAARREFDSRVAKNQAGTKEWSAAKQAELEQRSVALRNEIVTDLREQIRRASGPEISLIFDTSGKSLNGVPFVLKFPAKGDLTARINASNPAAFEPARNLRLGLVDMSEIFSQLEQTKKAEAEINRARQDAKQEYDRRTADYQNILERLKSLSGSARDREAEKVKEMEQEIARFRETKEKELTAEAVKKREPIVKEMRNAIDQQLQSEKSAFILDSSGRDLDGFRSIVFQRALPELSDTITAALRSASSKSQTVSPALVEMAQLHFACIDLRKVYDALPASRSIETEIKEAKLSQQEAQKKRDAILDESLAFVRKLAEREHYDVVFNCSARTLNGEPLLLVVNNISDLTQQVIAGDAGP